MNISATLPPLALQGECPSPPLLFGRLFEAFEQAGIGWCCWKGLRRLDDAFAGRSDLDLLVARTDRQKAVRALVDLGFRHAPDALGREDPAVMSFLGFDEDGGALLHVHAHFRLVLGPPMFRNNRLPAEAAFLARSRRLAGSRLRALAPEDAALLLFVRRQLEWGRLDPVQARQRIVIEDKFRQDFAALAPTLDAAALGRTTCEFFDAELAEKIAGAIIGDPMAARPDLRRAIARALAQHRLCGGFEAAFRGAARTALFLLGAFNKRFLRAPRIWGRRAPGGGAVIAFLGCDGSGKSTAAKTVDDWLGPEIDVLKCYFGTGDGAPSLLFAPFKALSRVIARFIKTKPKGASHGKISDQPPGPVYSLLFAVWALAVALDKRRKLLLVQRAARRGFIVVTDRWPQDEIEHFNDGPQLHRLSRAPEWLRRFERAIYLQARRAPPDLVIKLHVSAETVARREPDMNKALIEERLACLEQLRFPGAKVVSIDARAPLDEVTHAVKRAVWDVV